MGCDAHIYVEYKSKKRIDSSWYGFGQRINPGRNYWMFGLMAKGVRSDFEDSFECKGLPSDMCYVSKWDNLLSITDTGEGEGECTLERALKWKSSYGLRIFFRNEEPYAVEHPDWHSRSWLSVDEFKQVVNNYNKLENSTPEPKYEALLSAMEKLAEFDNDVRIVFWFDN